MRKGNLIDNKYIPDDTRQERDKYEDGHKLHNIQYGQYLYEGNPAYEDPIATVKVENAPNIELEKLRKDIKLLKICLVLILITYAIGFMVLDLIR